MYHHAQLSDPEFCVLYYGFVLYIVDLQLHQLSFLKVCGDLSPVG